MISEGELPMLDVMFYTNQELDTLVLKLEQENADLDTVSQKLKSLNEDISKVKNINLSVLNDREKHDRGNLLMSIVFNQIKISYLIGLHQNTMNQGFDDYFIEHLESFEKEYYA